MSHLPDANALIAQPALSGQAIGIADVVELLLRDVSHPSTSSWRLISTSNR